MKIGFVILHYQTTEATIACVNSILRDIDTDDFAIVIVDNGSPNDSGHLLKVTYITNVNIDVIINQNNIGFARGHNIGITFLRDKYACEFIVLLNNDTQLMGCNWATVIEQKYKKYEFDIMGPDIISIDGLNHANPADIQIRNIDDLEKMIKKKKLQIINNILYIIPLIMSLKKIIKKMIRYQMPIRKLTPSDKVDVQLQGSCFILSSKYLQKYEGLYDGTFLYFEEAIMKYMAERDNLVILYTPEISLIHKGGMLTNLNSNRIRKVNLFYLRNSLNSCKELLRMMKSDSD